MNNLLRLIFNSASKQSNLIIGGLLLMLSAPINAIDFQCKLVESDQLKPSFIIPMQNALNNGYLYRVQVDTSNVSFKVNHFPFSTVEGRFSEFEGGMALPKEIEKSKQALFVIKVASITTGDDDLNEYLKSSAFFNAAQFPIIMFVSTDFEWIDASTARLSGNLTLHGITKPLVFNVVIDSTENNYSKNSDNLSMLASAVIQRSDFGMHELQILVSDKVKFNLKLEAQRMPG